jgi:hypothetical protein
MIETTSSGILYQHCLPFRSIWVYPRFLVGLVLLGLYFYLYVLWIVAWPFVPFRLAIVLSVLLRYTDSDCPFDIFKLFQLTVIIISTVHSKLRCSGMVSSSCSTSGTRRVNLVTNPVISHEWGKTPEVFTTSEHATLQNWTRSVPIGITHWRQWVCSIALRHGTFTISSNWWRQ